MSDYGIKPEWAQAWKRVDKTRSSESKYLEDEMADLSLHLLAGWMESEFRREHALCKCSQMVALNPDRKWIEWSCKDPRHAYDHHAAWEADARKVMEGMGR